MSSTNRRYDIDWLRVIAIGLLLIYHIGIGFQPFGVLIGFIQSNKPLEALWVPMSMLNIWRIPLLFFVSGMGVCFAIRKRSWKQLLLERARRILLPFLFGMFAIVPLHVFLWQKYYNQEIAYTVHPIHLWFLANIFVYVLLLSPIFFYLKKKENGKFHRGLQKLFSKPWGLLVVVAAICTGSYSGKAPDIRNLCHDLAWIFHGTACFSVWLSLCIQWRAILVDRAQMAVVDTLLSLSTLSIPLY